ncbi:hypothetical protein B0H11DRAFT_1907452 [Mycena galericulata]|nr:hypothetical protein B0H11DRAFT_1907452 [Mycena galericulata]
MYQLGSSNLVPRKSIFLHAAQGESGFASHLLSSGDAFTTGELIFTTLHPVSQSTAPTSQARNVWLWRCKLQRTFLKLRQATIHPSTTTRWAARQLLPGEITAMNELFLTMAGCRMEPASLKYSKINKLLRRIMVLDLGFGERAAGLESCWSSIERTSRGTDHTRTSG